MAQITSRVSEELEAALNRWAAEEGCQRSDLIRNLLATMVEARKEGRTIFDKPDLPGPADIRRIVADVQHLSTELERVLRQNAKRDADLVRHAKDDAVGVSEARMAIISQLTAGLQRLLDLILARLSALSAEHVAALTASPAIAGVTASLKRLEEHPRLKEIATLQEAQTIAIRTLNADLIAARRDPRVQNSYSVFGSAWTGRMVGSALLVVWVGSVVLFLMLAMVLPPEWLALRTANHLLGGGDQAICQLVNYRMASDHCRLQFEGKQAGVIVTTRHGRASGR